MNKILPRALLVSICPSNDHLPDTQEYLDELDQLARTAHYEPVDRIVQIRKSPDPAMYFGTGKAEHISEVAKEKKVKCIIVDGELSPAQGRNLEKLTGCTIIDRPYLILEIFVENAKTREARTQVEIAQLEYLLPRLTRRWTHLERQRGGIGLRGVGEKQIELDRRMIRKRIQKLKKNLLQIEVERNTQRKRRLTDALNVALVGYANAGKSTLLNALTHSHVLAEDRLFATLDARVRCLCPDFRPTILVTDTVGFMRR
jgi:GTP-binding protein HflX